MKIHIGWVVFSAIIAGLVGWAGGTQVRSQEGSAVGQTLADLGRALEVEKARTGVYPDSISALVVESTSGDFSAAVLKDLIYQRTATGYIAFAGVPGVGYIVTGGAPQFR